MKVIKVKSNKTYKDKNGIERNYSNYYIEFDNGYKLAFKPCFKQDYKILDGVAYEYSKSTK